MIMLNGPRQIVGRFASRFLLNNGTQVLKRGVRMCGPCCWTLPSLTNPKEKFAPPFATKSRSVTCGDKRSMIQVVPIMLEAFVRWLQIALPYLRSRLSTGWMRRVFSVYGDRLSSRCWSSFAITPIVRLIWLGAVLGAAQLPLDAAAPRIGTDSPSATHAFRQPLRLSVVQQEFFPAQWGIDGKVFPEWPSATFRVPSFLVPVSPDAQLRVERSEVAAFALSPGGWRVYAWRVGGDSVWRPAHGLIRADTQSLILTELSFREGAL